MSDSGKLNMILEAHSYFVDDRMIISLLGLWRQFREPRSLQVVLG